MVPWFETVGVVIVIVSGVFFGRYLSRFREPYWVLGYLLSFSLIAMLITIRFTGSLGFVPPLYWVAAGRAKFVVLAVAVTVGFTATLSRLSRKRERVLICFLMAVVVIWFSVLPILLPALRANYHSKLQTKFDSQGNCYQMTDYTCAPAAAVTALRQLGLPGEEGEIAILSHTSPVVGTLPWCLYTALQERYSEKGLKCRYCRFDSIDQLRNAGITLVVLREKFLLNHCVAVLVVSDKSIIIADPVFGRMSMTHEQFEKVWQFTGIVLKRDPVQNI
ncbi:MAG: hypothetical protein JXB29_13245 [Sedimentisphaerales bacterium]|nr:hypothetical protein [Sedimentisphaerales bacterium]